MDECLEFNNYETQEFMKHIRTEFFKSGNQILKFQDVRTVVSDASASDTKILRPSLSCLILWLGTV